MHFTKISLVSLAVLGLAACGGNNSSGGGGGTTEPPTVTYDNTLPFGVTSDASSEVVFVVTDVDGNSASGMAVYDRSRETFDSTDFAGVLDPATGIVTLEGGGTATASELQDFSALLLVESPDGTTFGVLGIAPSDMPSGTVNYAGVTELTIIDPTALYELSGDFSAAVDFADLEMDVTLDNLSGTKANSFGVPQGNVANVGSISISDASIDSDGLTTGGSASLTSAEVPSVLSGSPDLVHEGSFFGPQYDEVGGVFVIDDTSAGSLKIYGSYVGD